MITLLHTRCSRTTRIVDSTLTGLGWTGFLYLCVNDVFAIPTQALSNLSSPTAFLWFGEVFLITVVALTSWSLYNKSRYCPRQTASGEPLTKDALSSSFHLSAHDISRLQDSVLCVIHHEDNGQISHVQTRHSSPEKMRLIA
ncbi:MAG TPA: poly-beta-1,6-N-acetyl-D-glucosamine biosynthesis protein PgaD [Pusillimonas sp.]|jgi:poly-beta-1,6-N-acetyl-D-glucosamine biosynthesis protein PgaD|nr:poly-beta-1,6-N-acetyl-D-glucosamine biosynthesis protein PgaD [Pusillimonas sp.]MBC41843.1 poly-beta-1,6-N-acetyl-D-glucosamine biosynthesis protein PgaD [Pusillimonas sp.]HBT33790.1 poly-beta-1,6-N-acetyl-D-glucosamine biosynthesis protein PgaD [Pusillimonas sp.]HCN71725.1 poly-beta-1,6-N-acetyl-D-glucosamine biosynthesis protein PgaD [Pusillimonas sp.]HCP77618.1 poly-beta-1,6-N-acetyl-D-glucosamine biosynthesis protein PgaD [Pusillimonas sp.]|tara:strand:- start:19513 stop:19938 length:426 start_codon:yes stop_codon:yes gene_type:complete